MVYIVKCADCSLYTGITNNLNARIAQHNLGKGAKYTRSRLPVELVYTEKKENKGQALSRELQIKKLAVREKRQLVADSGFISNLN